MRIIGTRLAIWIVVVNLCGPTLLQVVFGRGSHQLLDLPVVHSRAHRELQVFLSDGIPILVHHHDGQKIARCRKEQSIHIVTDRIANRPAEGIENDLANDEEEDAKRDIAQGPPVLKRPSDENDLQNHVDEELDGVEKVEHHKQADSVGGTKTSPRHESCERHQERDDKGSGRAEAHHPERERCPILV